ncbi:MAG: cytochrome c [Gallionella sp.]|nr:cytochrome c [Gallionella sp.]
MKKSFVLSVALSGLLFTAMNATAAEPLELQKVMKDLGKNMQIVTDGISREDWLLVEHTSHLIGGHPQPPVAEKMRIMTFMGANMAKFKEFDGQTHEFAHEMALAAQAKDGLKVISSFQKLQASCLACHQAFRPAFVEHFYGKSAN